MAKYRIPEKSFINNTIVMAGEIVEYDGIPGSTWEKIEEDKPAPKRRAAKDGEE